jgi:hypothetical protein
MKALYHHRDLLLATIILACVSVTYAQSGRRSSGGSTTTTTTPTVSGPRTIEKKPEKPPRLQLLVGIDNRDPSTNVPYYITDTVMDGVLRRLGDAADVIANSAGSPMNRAGAMAAAKEETTRYVVWLRIGSELADSGRQGSKNAVDELYVSYSIFEPVTGKHKQSGRSHHQIYQSARDRISVPNKTSSLYSEYALRQAAQETAERILGAFEIKLRDVR